MYVDMGAMAQLDGGMLSADVLVLNLNVVRSSRAARAYASRRVAQSKYTPEYSSSIWYVRVCAACAAASAVTAAVAAVAPAARAASRAASRERPDATAARVACK